MFEDYRNRVARRNGTYMGETMRKQTSVIVDATWMNSIYVRPVCVQAVNQGLPKMYDSADDFDETIWAHFKPNKVYAVGGNAVDYYLTFLPKDVETHSEIAVGSYVSIPNVLGEIETWMIVYISEDNDLIKTQILKCNWTLKWISDNIIRTCLCVTRTTASQSSGVEDAGMITTVDSDAQVWLPTNYDSCTIGVDTRFLISDERRMPPSAWVVTRLRDTTPVGIMQIGLKQSLYNPTTDNAELMIADYYRNVVTPIEPESNSATATIIYSGTTATIRVGGSFKTFTAVFGTEGVMTKSWTVSYKNGDISLDTENYTIEYIDGNMRLKVAQNYNLIGKILIVKAVGTDDSIAEVQVEVVG